MVVVVSTIIIALSSQLTHQSIIEKWKSQAVTDGGGPSRRIGCIEATSDASFIGFDNMGH